MTDLLCHRCGKPAGEVVLYTQPPRPPLPGELDNAHPAEPQPTLVALASRPRDGFEGSISDPTVYTPLAATSAPTLTRYCSGGHPIDWNVADLLAAFAAGEVKVRGRPRSAQRSRVR